MAEKGKSEGISVEIPVGYFSECVCNSGLEAGTLEYMLTLEFTQVLILKSTNAPFITEAETPV